MRSEIALLAQAQTVASPVVQAGGKVPAKHPGIELGRGEGVGRRIIQLGRMQCLLLSWRARTRRRSRNAQERAAGRAAPTISTWPSAPCRFQRSGYARATARHRHQTAVGGHREHLGTLVLVSPRSAAGALEARGPAEAGGHAALAAHDQVSSLGSTTTAADSRALLRLPTQQELLLVVLKICPPLRDTVEVARLRKLLERHYLQDWGNA